jgi:NAD(P)-dependent dehydrogenase (short-subunit alcohol dehydrogenase family)
VKTIVDFEGDAVIVTGGTRGLGKALGMEFSRAGATVFLTHRWGSVDEAELRAEFESASLPVPNIVESDASDPQATRSLMRMVANHSGTLAAAISNVAFAQIVDDIGGLKRASLELSLRHSTWPVLDLVHAAREVLGHYPRYVLGISTLGADLCLPGYDMVGIAKAALESLCRYLALRLRDEGVTVNAIRCGPLDTAGSRATFGDAVFDSGVLQQTGLIMDPHDVARACVALCSGLMDSVTGQVIAVDEGISLKTPFAYIIESLSGPRRHDEGDGRP